MPKSDATRPPAPPKDYFPRRPNPDQRPKLDFIDLHSRHPVSSEPTELIPAWQALQIAFPLMTIDERLFERNIQAINSQIRKAALNHKLEVTVWVSSGLERPLFDHLAGQYSVCEYRYRSEPTGFIKVSWSHASPRQEDGPHGPMPPPPPRQADLNGWDVLWLKRRVPKPPT